MKPDVLKKLNQVKVDTNNLPEDDAEMDLEGDSYPNNYEPASSAEPKDKENEELIIESINNDKQAEASEKFSLETTAESDEPQDKVEEVKSELNVNPITSEASTVHEEDALFRNDDQEDLIKTTDLADGKNGIASARMKALEVNISRVLTDVNNEKNIRNALGMNELFGAVKTGMVYRQENHHVYEMKNNRTMTDYGFMSEFAGGSHKKDADQAMKVAKARGWTKEITVWGTDAYLQEVQKLASKKGMVVNIARSKNTFLKSRGLPLDTSQELTSPKGQESDFFDMQRNRSVVTPTTNSNNSIQTDKDEQKKDSQQDEKITAEKKKDSLDEQIEEKEADKQEANTYSHSI